MEADPLEVEESSESGDDAQQYWESKPAPPPPPREETRTELPQIPPHGSGARLGFLLGVNTSPSSTRGGAGLPPVAGVGSSRKRGHAPPDVATSHGGGRNQDKGQQHVEKKRKHAAGHKQPQNAKSPSPVATSCSSQGQAPFESVNYISDDEEDEVVEVTGRKSGRKLTSDVWNEMTKKLVHGKWKAICNYCNKQLSAESKSGTTHLREHLKICTQRMIKLSNKGGKSFSQSSLRMTAQRDGKVNVENYTFDQETAREELGNMIVLHDYPLSMVDHAGFRRFVHAVQPLFTLHTRNTYRKDIIGRYDKEKKVAVEFIYVPAPHSGDVIDEVLHETLMAWNLDDKLMTVTVDNCTSNDKALDLMVGKIGKSKLLLQAQQRPAAARLQGGMEHYLSDDLVPYTEKFNVLDWWKVAGTRYPTLIKVARDVFAIPATTVASESAFSTSGRIVNEHRSRLTSHILEVLMCYQDWLRNKYKDAHIGEGSFWICLQDKQEGNEQLV